MFLRLGPIETGIFGLGIEAQRQGIPEEERCWNCDGRGQICNYTLMHVIYTTCCHCGGTGKHNKDLKKSLRRVRKIKETKIGA